MQTFLPIGDVTFKADVAVLDWQRLGKQRGETHQLLTAESLSRINHPANVMWRGHEYQLCLYGIACCDEWLRRGYNDSTRLKFVFLAMHYVDTGLPSWFGGPIHSNHRGRLLAKLPSHYQQFNWPEAPREVNYWPSKN